MEVLREMIKKSTGVADDSRLVKKGNIFVAVSGANFDGHDFIPAAFKRGAALVIGERDLKISNYCKVSNAREALGLLSSLAHGQPSHKLKVVGVTGTDGKTTTSHLIGEILNNAGTFSSTFSTINVPGVHTTTPPAPVLQNLLKQSVQKGDEAAVVEVTSHGIAQKRIAGIKFSAAVLTNVTSEHLDYHENFKRYRKTKGELFKIAPLSVLNQDDPSFDFFSRQAVGRVVSYGFCSNADFKASDSSLAVGKSRFKLEVNNQKFTVNLPLPGEYNISNALAAIALSVSLTGIPIAKAISPLERFDPRRLTGRFQKITGTGDVNVLVDFAHTTNGLSQILNYVARVKPARARLLVVFGAAGERDHYKRPQMGAIASRLADLTILTAEDPRSEDPQTIVAAIAEGCLKEEAVEGDDFVLVPDRREAISLALKNARGGDWVLVLGKGHETTMNFNGIEYPWSDQEVIEEEFKKL